MADIEGGVKERFDGSESPEYFVTLDTVSGTLQSFKADIPFEMAE